MLILLEVDWSERRRRKRDELELKDPARSEEWEGEEAKAKPAESVRL